MPEVLDLRNQVEELAAEITALASRPLRLMEVCGTHAHAVARWGLRQLLPPQVELLSGPGCPVCVTPSGAIDQALELARREGVVVATFGDMMLVPGSQGSLADLRAQGAQVRVVYSPAQAVDLARQHPEREIVLLGVGFETTAPTMALALLAARDLANFSLLCMLRLVPPALRALLASDDTRLDGLLCPGHVSTVIGLAPYERLVAEFALPCAVAGFEPHDIMRGLLSLVRQATTGAATVDNQYQRAVRPPGNPRAQAVIAEVFEPCDAEWRWLGAIPTSGLRLREQYARFDAVRRYELRPTLGYQHPLCRCGEVLRGVLRPAECAAFGGACVPEHPLGPCMVSSEGACAAIFRYESRPAVGSSV